MGIGHRCVCVCVGGGGIKCECWVWALGCGQGGDVRVYALFLQVRISVFMIIGYDKVWRSGSNIVCISSNSVLRDAGTGWEHLGR